MLKLPLEVRVMIYRYCIPRNEAFYFMAYYWDEAVVMEHMAPRLDINVGLLGINRQIHNETIPILYGENRFIFEVNFAGPLALLNSCYSMDMFPSLSGGDMGCQIPSLSDHSGDRIPGHVLYRINQCQLVITIASANLKPLGQARVEFSEIVGDVNPIQSFLEEFVRFLGGARSNLMDLEVLCAKGCFESYRPVFIPKGLISSKFILEPLAKLRGIKRVKINGLADGVFTRKLCHVMGWNKNRTLGVIDYPEKRRRKDGDGVRSKKIITRRRKRWYHPKYDWDSVVLPHSTTVADAKAIDDQKEDTPSTPRKTHDSRHELRINSMYETPSRPIKRTRHQHRESTMLC